MKNNKLIILDFLYSINNSDFYVDAITNKGIRRKVKLSKNEYIQWCEEIGCVDCCFLE